MQIHKKEIISTIIFRVLIYKKENLHSGIYSLWIILNLKIGEKYFGLLSKDDAAGLSKN